MFTLNGQLGGIFFGAVILLAVVAVPVQSMGAAPAEWRQLSRLQVNPPGIQAFVETAFSYNQLKAVPGGDLFLGFTAVRDANPNKDTDVYVSRYVRSEDRWGSPAAIAESPALERSPAVWVDGRSGVIHFSWVGNERRKQRKQRSELRVGHRRSEDGGTSWTPPRQFAVGTVLARRPQLMGDGRGNLNLAVSNGYPGERERIHLFQSNDGGKDWRPVDVNVPEGRKRGGTASPRLAVGPGVGACLVWIDRTAGRRAVVFSRSGGDFSWSVPVRVNDDPSMSCQGPRLAVREDSIYVAWHVVKGDRTTLYFDHSPDGGATWNQDQVIFDRKALSVRSSLQPVNDGLLAGWFESRERLGPDPSPALLSSFFGRKGLEVRGRGERLSGGGPWTRQVLLRIRPSTLARGMPGCLFQRSDRSIARDLSGLERGVGVRLLGVDENQCAKKGFRASIPPIGPLRRERSRRGLQSAEGPPVAYGAAGHPRGCICRSNRNSLVETLVGKPLLVVWKTLIRTQS